MSTATLAPAPTALKTDFSDLVTLLDGLTETQNDLNALNAQLNTEHLANVRLHADRYKALQARASELTAALEVIAKRNPQWFAEKATLATPYGEVKRTSSTSLVVPDEAVTITLIKAAKREDDFLKTTTTVRLEVMEKLEDADLAKFGIQRKTEYNYNTKAAAVNLGKSVAAASKTVKKAAAS